MTRPLAALRADLVDLARERRVLLAAFGIGLAALGGTLQAFRWPTSLGNVSLSRFGALVLVLIVVLAVNDEYELSFVNILTISVALLVSWVASLLYTPFFSSGVIQIGNVVEGLLLLLGAYVAVRYATTRSAHPEKTLGRLARVPLWASIPAGLLGVLQASQVATGNIPTIPFIHLARLTPETANAARVAFSGGFVRIAGALGDPPTFGLLGAFLFAYALWLRRAGLVALPLFAVSVALATFSALASASVTALAVFGLAVAWATPGWVRYWVHRWQVVPLAGGLALAAIAAIVLVAPVGQAVDAAYGRTLRFISGDDFSRSTHFRLAEEAWVVIGEEPVWGVGAAALEANIPGDDGVIGVDIRSSSVHNALLLRMGEGGVVGGLFLAAFWLALWWDFAPRLLVVMMVAAMLLYIDFNRLPYLWVMLGVAAAVVAARRGAWWSDAEPPKHLAPNERSAALV